MTDSGATDGRATWRRSREALRYVNVLHGGLPWPLTGIVFAGVVAGAAEAVSLLALIRAAIGISSNADAVSLFPGIPGRMSPGAALLIALVLAVIAAVLHVVLARSTVRLGTRVSVVGRGRLIDAYLAASWTHVSRYSPGGFQHAIMSLADKSGWAAVHLANALSALVIALSLAAVALWVSTGVAAVVVIVPLFGYLVARRHLARIFERSDTSLDDALNLAQAASETSSLGLEYRVAGVERQQAELLRSTATTHTERLAELRTKSLTVNFMSRDFVMISLIAIVAALHFVLDLRASIAAAVLIVVRMFGYLQQAFRVAQDGVEELAAALALRDVIGELDLHRQPDGTAPISEITTLDLVDVTYCYDGARNALGGVTLSIPVNSTIGVVGPSGAGKSTLAEVLLGLRSPDSGNLRVNGIDLGSLLRGDWARLTAFVPQHQQFAAMSVGENIRFLRPWITDDDVVDAARRAHVLEEIERLPNGFDHRLASRTRGLSGGQRQRIAIARALAGRPSLLVLDEPTSALDAVTEQRIRRTLDELHGTITIVVIAHRPATLEACDVVVSLAHGLVESIVPALRSRG